MSFSPSCECELRGHAEHDPSCPNRGAEQVSNEKGFDAEKGAAGIVENCPEKPNAFEADHVGYRACFHCIELALQRAYDAGRRSGVEAATRKVDGWHVKKGGYGELAHGIRALIGREKP